MGNKVTKKKTEPVEVPVQLTIKDDGFIYRDGNMVGYSSSNDKRPKIDPSISPSKKNDPKHKKS